MNLFAITFQSVIFEYTYQSLIIILILSGPPIAIASLIGLLVAIVQAATQIQEQTFAFAIKMVAIIGTLMLMGGWISSLMIEFATQLLKNFYKLQL